MLFNSDCSDCMSVSKGFYVVCDLQLHSGVEWIMCRSGAKTKAAGISLFC